MATRYLAVVATLLLLFGLIIVKSLNSINSLSVDTRDNVLQAVSDNLRTAINLEKLFRFAQIIYRSPDPLERRRFMLASHVLSQDAAFERNQAITDIVRKTAEQLREIHALRGRQTMIMRRARVGLETMQAENPSFPKGVDPIPAMARAIYTDNDTEFYESIEQLKELLGNPALKGGAKQTLLRDFVENLETHRAQENRLKSLWHAISTQLDRTIGQLSIRTVQTASERFTVIASKAEQAFYLGAACFILISASLVSIIFLIRRDILRPVLNSVTILDQVQQGKTPDAFPGARLRELDDIGRAVERSARLMRQIAERTEELEKTNAALVREISEHRKTERQLAAAKASAEAAGRAKSDFLAGMSHEIRTPMNSILGMAELMLETDLTKQQRRYIDTFKSSSELLLGILNDVLDFSKIEAGQLQLAEETVNIRTCIEEVANIIRDKVKKKGLAFQEFVAPDVPDAVVADRVRLSQILLNLLDNAVKFTEQGHVELSISTEPHEKDGMLNLSFAVSDTGIGIPQHMQNAIFGRFTQADASTTRKYGGSGLGLAICRALADLMGGSLILDSNEGEGTRVLLRAPFEIAAAPEGSKRPDKENVKAIEAQIRKRKPTILVAEDSDSNRGLLELFMQNCVERIDFAENGVEAVALYRTSEYDLVLMDIQMPEMDGYGATRMIRAIEKEDRRTQTPIVALTANAMQDDERRCLSVGCDFYLSKPVSKLALLQTIRNHLG
ncbi:ATP-binding protein [Salidesulfovibrio brasiliensis]|uniref:ATP-binding protein n=1 Tax=Salidesulfovibrio brasiliensis TaxID=221711 RepID=UPI000A9C96D3|nr:ATP-binding protein [Salidesulfovibrio brasiliensis]